MTTMIERRGFQRRRLSFRLGMILSDLPTPAEAPVRRSGPCKGFAQAGGMIELYVEGGRMRFAINMDAAERSGLRLSSRLLGLAKVIRTGHVQ